MLTRWTQVGFMFSNTHIKSQNKIQIHRLLAVQNWTYTSLSF